MGKIKELLIKYKEPVLYVVFGVLTTVVGYASYWIFTDFLHIPYMVSTALSWVLSVTFAYVTNRKWVLRACARLCADFDGGGEIFCEPYCVRSYGNGHDVHRCGSAARER